MARHAPDFGLMTDIAQQTRQKMQRAMAELRDHVHEEDLSWVEKHGEPFSQWLLSRIDGMPLLEPVKSTTINGETTQNRMPTHAATGQ